MYSKNIFDAIQSGHFASSLMLIFLCGQAVVTLNSDIIIKFDMITRLLKEPLLKEHEGGVSYHR